MFVQELGFIRAQDQSNRIYFLKKSCLSSMIDECLIRETLLQHYLGIQYEIAVFRLQTLP